jgi:hypothetical protein
VLDDDFYHRQHQAGHLDSSREGDLPLSRTQHGDDSTCEPELKDARNPDNSKIVSLNKSVTQRAVGHWSETILPPSQNSSHNSSQNSSQNLPKTGLKKWVNDFKRKTLPEGEDHLEKSIEELLILLKKSENEHPPSEDDAKFRRQFCQVKDMCNLDEIYLQRRLGMVPEIEKNKATEPIPKRVMEAFQNYVKATHSRDVPDQRDIGIVRQCENQEGIIFQTKQKRVHLDRSHGPSTETTYNVFRTNKPLSKEREEGFSIYNDPSNYSSNPDQHISTVESKSSQLSRERGHAFVDAGGLCEESGQPAKRKKRATNATAKIRQTSAKVDESGEESRVKRRNALANAANVMSKRSFTSKSRSWGQKSLDKRKRKDLLPARSAAEDARSKLLAIQPDLLRE